MAVLVLPATSETETSETLFSSHFSNAMRRLRRRTGGRRRRPARRTTRTRRWTKSRSTRRSRRARRPGAPGASNVGSGVVRLIRQPQNLFPERFVTKQTYNVYVAITTNASGFGTYIMSANSVYDPDETSIGSFASGYNRLASIYNTYRVNASKIKVELLNAFWGQNTLSGTAPVVLQSLTSPAGSVYDAGIIALPQLSSQMFAYDRNIVESAWCTHRSMPVGGQGGQPRRFKMYTNIKRLFGKTGQEWATDKNFEAAIGLEPATQGFFQVYVQQIGPATAAQVLGQITMTYYTTWFNRNFYIM